MPSPPCRGCLRCTAASATRRACLAGLSVVVALVGILAPLVARAAEAPVALGTAGTFAVLADAGVTNAGPTVLTGDVGACTAPSVTGFPPGVVDGTIHVADPAACGAHADLAIAYADAAGRTATTTHPPITDLGGMTLMTGVHRSPSSFAISGTLTLDAQGDPNAVFVFQATSTFITGAGSDVSLLDGAQACNVFWQVGSSATLGADSTLVGTVLAHSSITAGAGAAVQGRLLARDGATTLDSNTVTTPACAPPIPSGSLSLDQTSTAGTALVEGVAVALPETTVTDGRSGTARNWTVTATVTDLVSGVDTIPASEVTLAQSGSFTAGSGVVVAGDGLVSVTGASLDSVYTYTPTAELHPQGDIPAGSYAGTVTQTVA